MFWSVCSVKGGVGTTVVSAALALELASVSSREVSSREVSTRDVVLVDMCGDQPNVLGVDVGARPGVVDWLTADGAVVDGALEHLLIDVAPGLQLLPCGSTSLRDARNVDPARCTQLANEFPDNTDIVVDLGVLPVDPMSSHALISATSDRRTAVLRACYLTLRRANPMPIEIDSLVEVTEPGRALTTLDLELIANLPVTAKLRLDPGIARAVDAGLLATRRPRALRRAMRDLISGSVRTASRDRAVA